MVLIFGTKKYLYSLKMENYIINSHKS